MAYGDPQPQGSKTAVLSGTWITVNGQRALLNPRAHVIEARRGPARTAHKAWRNIVDRAARTRWHHEPLDGPVAITISFYLPRPKSTPKKVLYPATGYDLDKLTRCVGDSLSALLVNDSRIVRAFTEKLYADAGRPRAIVTIETLPATLDELRYQEARKGNLG